MPRKTTGSSTTTRSKKTAAAKQTAPVQAETEVIQQVSKEIPQNGKPSNVVPIKQSPDSRHLNLNIEDQIRRRAYELYLERRAIAGDAQGHESEDWLIAEREIRSRQSGQEHSA